MTVLFMPSNSSHRLRCCSALRTRWQFSSSNWTRIRRFSPFRCIRTLLASRTVFPTCKASLIFLRSRDDVIFVNGSEIADWYAAQERTPIALERSPRGLKYAPALPSG